MRIPPFARFLTPLTLAVALAACAPGANGDAGPGADAAEAQDDAGGVDAGHDAGEQTRRDGGAPSECPTIGPLSNPEGEACDEEGKICPGSGCLAPGPGCLFIQCHNGVWTNQSLIDAGVIDDAGDEPDAGESDAGDPADAGEGDAGA